MPLTTTVALVNGSVPPLGCSVVLLPSMMTACTADDLATLPAKSTKSALTLYEPSAIVVVV